MKTLALIMSVAMLSACGVSETAATAAIGGKSKAEEIEHAKVIEQRMLDDIDKANQQARERLDAAESQ